MFVIKANPRDSNVEREDLKKTGELPAVFYGAGKETTSVSVSTTEFKKVWREAGESSAVKIRMPNGDIDVLIHDVQVDPVTDEPIHADFLAIDMTKKITVEVPLEFIGISNAVKSGTGNLVKVLHKIEVEALPSNLPHSLQVDISTLETVDSQIFVSDIKLSTGVVAITPDRDVVASIVAQVEEKEEVAPPADLSEIEVEKKGKKEEEGQEFQPEEASAPAEEEKAEKK